LFFATANSGPEAMADNIRTLRFQFHCDVIIDDAIYIIESPYEDDIIAQAVNDVTADGALYFSSAGNQGNFDDGTSGTWEGDFKSAGGWARCRSGSPVHPGGNGVTGNGMEANAAPLTLHWPTRARSTTPHHRTTTTCSCSTTTCATCSRPRP